MSNFTFFCNVFYGICILKSYDSHISIVICSFLEFGTVSKCNIRECVNTKAAKCDSPRFSKQYDLTLSQMTKSLDEIKLKAHADDKLNVAKMMISLLDGVQNTVGKEENAGYQHFLLFPQCFPKPSSLGSLKVGTVW